jgi:hypothetical protein
MESSDLQFSLGLHRERGRRRGPPYGPDHNTVIARTESRYLAANPAEEQHIFSYHYRISIYTYPNYWQQASNTEFLLLYRSLHGMCILNFSLL